MKTERDQLFWESLAPLEDQHWISSSLRGKGEFEFSGSLRFGGSWQGTIESHEEGAHLFVRASAKLQGRISAERITVEGQLEDVEVLAKYFHALPGARIRGRVRAESVVVDEGAMLEGRLVVQDSSKGDHRPLLKLRAKPAI